MRLNDLKILVSHIIIALPLTLGIHRSAVSYILLDNAVEIPCIIGLLAAIRLHLTELLRKRFDAFNLFLFLLRLILFLASLFFDLGEQRLWLFFTESAFYTKLVFLAVFAFLISLLFFA